MQIIFEYQSATRAVAQAMAQGFQLHEPELWAFLSLDNDPTRPSFGMDGPGWLAALGWARHITILTAPTLWCMLEVKAFYVKLLSEIGIRMLQIKSSSLSFFSLALSNTSQPRGSNAYVHLRRNRDISQSSRDHVWFFFMFPYSIITTNFSIWQYSSIKPSSLFLFPCRLSVD